MMFFIYLTPLIPLSMIGISSLHEGEERKEGLAPLLDAPVSRLTVLGKGGAIWLEVDLRGAFGLTMTMAS